MEVHSAGRLVQRSATAAQRAGSTHGVDTWDKGMTHVPGATEQARARFHHATENSMPLKTYSLFLSENFHLISSDHKKI